MPLHALRISTGELIENHGRGPGSSVARVWRRIPISVANEPFRSFDAGKMHEDMGVWKPSFAFETDQFI
jgi:hypothetical protein